MVFNVWQPDPPPPSIPDDWNAVHSKIVVCGENGKALFKSLGDDQPVEWITMVMRQCFGA